MTPARRVPPAAMIGRNGFAFGSSSALSLSQVMIISSEKSFGLCWVSRRLSLVAIATVLVLLFGGENKAVTN
jgi:hypothetical protein